jgi:16S rRNA (uracil1498-N3)-methyltransferase
MPNLTLFTEERSYLPGESYEILLTELDLSFKPEVGQFLRIGFWPSGYGFGKTFVIEITKVTGDLCVIKVLKELCYEESMSITLIVALPRPQMLKKILESLTCYPVKKLILLGSERVEKSYFKSKVLLKESLENHLKCGSIQSGFSFKSEVLVLEKFWNLFENLNEENEIIRLFTDTTSSVPMFDIPEFNVADGKASKDIILTVGPESGWSDRECCAFRDHGFSSVSLGISILRVDVAVISSLSQLYALKKVEYLNL